MKIGLIGLPLSGKTTVFNLLTGRSEETAGFAGGRQAGHRAAIKVPDRRVDRLAEIFRPKKTTHAEIEFVDLPGLKIGQGGLESERLNEMRQLDALAHVLRLFAGGALPRAEGSVDAVRDAEALEQELILTDLLLVEKRLERLATDLAKGRKELAAEQALMQRMAEHLSDEKPLRSMEFNPSEEALIKGYQLLSRLPMILLGNGDETPAPAELAALESMAAPGRLAFLAMNALAEWDISRLAEDERADFLADLGVEEPARDRFIRTCYALLKQISFFTVGEDEVKAWTIERDLPAVKAAGKIHSDLERGFIRAEVIAYDDFLAHGSLPEARKHGALRLEGKEYAIADGEIVTIRFNV